MWWVLLLSSSCQQPEPVKVYPAFYHWRTRLQPRDTEQQALNEQAVARLYVRFFDVDWDEAQAEAVPLAVLEADSAIWRHLPQVCPVVFITNRTLEQLPAEQLPALARNLVQKISDLAKGWQPSMIQLDCDWTGGTREAYFSLLKHIRGQLAPGTQLSATIRLHQYRDPAQTGLPPIDRGMLMFYNMGELEAWDEPNSILNLTTAFDYIQHAQPYPLPLDVALPLFSWTVLFRDGQLAKLITQLDEVALSDTSLFEPIGQQRYRVKRSSYWQGYYLYAGDRLRLEGVSEATLVEAAWMLRQVINTDTCYLAYYHLDSLQLSRFKPQTLQQAAKIIAKRPHSTKND